MHIIRLPEQLVRLIRAGEVVERPASLVKEFIENAIDAGATHIKVAVERAGKHRIRVVDDGCGMSPEDLAICMERHATSKLHSEDLTKIATLGFRGEALAAAAAVAEVTITSRQDRAEHAWKVVAKGGVCGDPLPSSGVKGTTVEAVSVFSGHPAREAFLASDRREAALIRDAVEGAALANPNIAFTLDTDGRHVLNLLKGTWQERVAAVFGQGFTLASVEFSSQDDNAFVRGFIGLPNASAHGSTHQKFIINGRAVQEKVISSALRLAYAPLSKETAPAAFVELCIPRGEVDVNAHPAKTQVRLRHPDQVHALVTSAVAAVLSGGGAQAASALTQAAAAAAKAVILGPYGDQTRLPLGRAIETADGKYIISIAGSSLIVTDAHAAHERVVHERIKAAALMGGGAGRILKVPVVIDIGETAAALIDEKSASLARFGLRIQAMDGGAVVILSIPELLPDASAHDIVAGVARALSEDPHSDPLGNRIEAICAAASCHAALRDGDNISVERANILLRELEASPNGGTCMHGRPLSIEYTFKGFDKIFQRI